MVAISIDLMTTSIGLVLVMCKVPVKVGSCAEDTDSPEANEVPVLAAPKPTKDTVTDLDKANANGGLTVTGYLPGVIGRVTSGIPSDESEIWCSCHGSVISRAGGGTGTVITTECSRVLILRKPFYDRSDLP